MDQAEIERLQRSEHSLQHEVEQLRAQLQAVPGGHIALQGGVTTPAGRDALYAAIDKTRMPMILTDPSQPDNPIIFVNRAFQTLSGYAEDDLLGRNCRFLQGAGTDQAQVAEIREAVANRQEIAIEILNYHRDGTSFINDLFISPIFEQDGALLYFFASQLDVTGARRDRRLADERGVRERAIIDSAADFAIVATNRDGKVTDWNSGAERVFGWTEQEMLGQSADRFFTSEDRAAGQASLEIHTALTEGRAANEGWRLRKSGARFWASGEMLPLRGEAGMHLGFLKIVRDRTEQHEVGQRLEKSEERYRALFEALDAGFCVIEMVFDLAGNAVDYEFIEVNPAFERQTGLTGVTGRLMRDLAPNLEQQWYDTYGRVAMTGKPVRFEKAAEGLGRWYDVQAFRIGDPAEHRVAILFNDISVRRQIEKDLQALTTSLESEVAVRTGELMAAEEALRQSQKMEAVGQLTGGIAHDFNNLLTGITGSLEVLGRRIAQGRLSGLERYIEGAQTSAVRAAALIHRLLAFSRRQTLDPRPTAVDQLVLGMEDLIRRTMGPAITLDIVPFDQVWPTMVDPNQLENALLNLCINARDAMPNGGSLTVETGNTVLDERAARECDLLAGEYVSLAVTDTGVGMEQGVIARAFEPFFTTKPTGEGTGLGLSMIYGFAKQSGGQVRIQSTPGLGTTMRLYLPRLLGRVPETSSLRMPRDMSRTTRGETVLVVDDEPVVRMLVLEALEEHGYVTLDCADGVAGLQRLNEAGQIDLLVTDVGLPGGINGRQLADAARVRRPELKVLFITGYAESAAAVGNGSLAQGMEVLTKPFDSSDLLAKVRGMLTTAG